MDLDLNDEQQMLRDLVRDLCTNLSSPETVRKLEDDPTGFSPELWTQLADLDLIGLLIPEKFGGSGMSLIEGAVVYQEFGRALASSPHLVSAIFAGDLLARCGTDEQQQSWLPRIAKGDAIMSVAWVEPDNGFGPTGVQVRATEDPSTGQLVLTGLKRHVAFASAADALLVPVRVGDAPTDIAIVIVDTKADGLALRQQMTMASDTQHEATFTNVRVGAPNVIPGGWGAWAHTLDRAMVLTAAQAIGGAQAALDITVQYAKDRVQFDKPLGAFQAISHYLADAKTAIDGGEVLVYEAAWSGAEGRSDAPKLAAMAKLFAGQTYRDTTAMAQQVHGGIGFTLEADIQLYFRRAKALQLSWGDDRYCEERIAAALLD